MPYITGELPAPKITVAAVAFGAVLFKIVTSPGVAAALTGVITKALDVSF